MKQMINTKKLLKATIAFSAFVLVGCVGASSDDYYWDYSQAEENSYSQPMVEEDTFIEEEVFVQEEVLPCEEELKTIEEARTKATRKSDTKQLYRSVAASSPAKPRIVPTKPANKCIESQTVDCPFAKENVKKEVEVKQKPSVVSALNKEKSKVVKPVPAVKPVVKEELIENKNSSAVEKVEAPVVDNVIENKVDATKEKTKNIAVIDDIISEDTAVIIDLPDNMAELEAQKAIEDARLTAQVAEEEAKLAELKAAQEAERLRLQKEMEELEAKKKILEEEKVKITQIQKNAPQSCEDVKDWVAAEGTTLRSLLLEWGNLVGWRVVWNMDRDYTLEAGAVFRGRFVDVAAALLRSFARATPAPKGVFYKGNKVLVISTREDENAD